ncbi:hypothetical protein FC72_GL001374 [Companilactobacillus tucceti DSM 20183]|uniref:TIR domain-containing protein n=1 Tax=Companilactobacillus tucceti DSM 20183 TaxID=1423811 RepID=A0A0R1J260_9LACO|nr:hypothetical protein [Companilactobacillus tucceti]KRK65304.1 hypothetical protein FC72_GL001374 [Companilactobacillus tucceti DSM 20183]
MPYKKYKNKEYTGITDIVQENIGSDAKDELHFLTDSGVDKEGEIKGWMGIHSSINSEVAKKNDDNFKKNKLYNPLKLRVYVRNKLAIDDFLPVINNNQIYANFIEGEISYNILDDDDFPDIATTSRQNMDENDDRVISLARILKREISNLISSRLKVKNLMKSSGDKLDETSNSSAKTELSNVLDKTFKKSIDEGHLDESNLNNMKKTILQNVRGEVLKKDHMIFFSHSRKNKNIMDFFYYLLKSIGVNESEMFYTSREDRSQMNENEVLEKVSKNNIINTNTEVFFYTTSEFQKSEYCMFEGGAAWATRTEDDIFVICDNYNNVPRYLNNNDKFLFQINKDTDIYKGENYNKIIRILNFLINHINKGRELNFGNKIPLFEESEFPDRVEEKNGKKAQLNKDIEEYWSTFVSNKD